MESDAVGWWVAGDWTTQEWGEEVRRGTAARPSGLATLKDPSARGADGGPGVTHQFSRGRLVGLRFGHNPTQKDFFVIVMPSGSEGHSQNHEGHC